MMEVCEIQIRNGRSPDRTIDAKFKQIMICDQLIEKEVILRMNLPCGINFDFVLPSSLHAKLENSLNINQELITT